MSLDEAAGIAPASPLAPSLPRSVRLAIERARKGVHKAAIALDALTEKVSS